MDTTSRRLPDLLLLAAIVAATLTTAYIHYNLGGMLFLLNALGYLGLAVLLVLPLPFLVRLRPIILLGLAGYTTATIAGWLVMGPYFDLAYFTKAVEVVLLVLIGTLLYRTRADFLPSLRYLRSLVSEVGRIALRRPAAGDASET